MTAVLLFLGTTTSAAATSERCGPAGDAAQRLLHADTAGSQFGVDGAGVKVGIISNSFASNGQGEVDADVAAGWLPGPGNPCGYESPVVVLTEGPDAQDDEGRAMAQVVHQVAPGAEIFFAASDSDVGFAGAVADLRAQGVSIIVDDLASTGDRQYHVGAVGQAIQAATDAGVFYVTAAGNFGVPGAAGYPSEGYPIGAWSTVEYRPTECPDDVAGLYPGDTIDCLDFDPGPGEDATLSVTLPAGSLMTGSVDWAEDDGDVTTSLDYVLGLPGNTIKSVPADPEVASTFAEIGNLTSPDAIQNEVSVVRHVTPTAGFPPVAITWGQAPGKETLVDQEYYRSTDTDTVGATLYGHRADPAAFSVAALNAEDSTLETYSSLGPAPLYFGVPEPITVPGPTAVGVDNLPTSTTVIDDTGRFRGTSAAAPTIAASAALVLDYAPDLGPAELREALTDHASTESVIQPWNPAVAPERSVGAGLIDVASTLTALAPAQPAPQPLPDTSEAGPALAATGQRTPWLLALFGIGIAAVGISIRSSRRASEARR
ncbi:S8 family serine peptidase [Herbiconiux sp. YIM B11900]|uniref:S8 family serine peptidase n=1 Tax=Herbiconiux sp. YIM B11900 TaxID=3404131 RepID=UPI003F853E4E